MIKTNTKEKKVIPELHDIEEPVFEQPTMSTEEELARLEAEDAEEDLLADAVAEADDEGIEPMTEAELTAMTGEVKAAEKSLEKKTGAPKRGPGATEPKAEKTIVSNNKNLLSEEKVLLYIPPTDKEWEKLHELKPARIIFYYTMTKEEYKKLFLFQVKYRTKIVGSTGARVI